MHGFTSAVWHRQQKHLIAVSHAVKDSLVEQGIEPTKISVLHNAVDPADVQPRRLPALIREELGAAAETPVVGCFAHLSAKKGWLELVRAMPLILRDVPEAQLWCVGDGPLRDTLQDEAEREGVAGRVRFTGFRRDVADLMRAVDVVALPSYREPLGLVYLEAGLLGRPVVGCKAGGAPEVIRDQDSGLLVPPHDSVALAEAISRLLLNRAEARQMGHRGLERARDEFNWSGYLDKLLDVYDIMRN